MRKKVEPSNSLTKKEQALEELYNLRFCCESICSFRAEFKDFSLFVPRDLFGENAFSIENEAEKIKVSRNLLTSAVANGNSTVCFLRKKEEIEKPYLSITLGIEQGKYFIILIKKYDGPVSKEEEKLLKKWVILKKNLFLNPRRDKKIKKFIS